MSQTLKDLLNNSFERHAERTAVRVLRQAELPGEKGLRYVPLTYRQVKEQRDRLASGLARLGLEKGQRLGLLTDGGLESVLVFLACDMLGLTAVPICNKLPDDLLVHNINHSGIVYLFADAKSLEQVVRVREQLDAPPQVVLTEGQADGATSFFELAQKGATSPPPDVAIDPDDESKIVYTSGSSGLPKGRDSNASQPRGQCPIRVGYDQQPRCVDFFQIRARLSHYGHFEYLLPLGKGLDLGSRAVAGSRAGGHSPFRTPGVFDRAADFGQGIWQCAKRN